MSETYKEINDRKNKENLSAVINFINNHSLPEIEGLKGDLDKMYIEVKMNDLEDSIHDINNSRGRICMGQIYFKGFLIGLIYPNLSDSSYDRKKSGPLKENVYEVSVYGMFHELSSRSRFIDSEVKGDYNVHDHSGAFRAKTVSEIILKINNVRVGIQDVLSGFLDVGPKMVKSKYDPNRISKCVDKHNSTIESGDFIDLQDVGILEAYTKDDGNLYFKSYGNEERVSSHYSNDMIKCDENGKHKIDTL